MSFEQDYCDLFLRKRSGHMGQYVYMYRPHIYEDLIKQDVYYPFKMESDLLIQRSLDMCKNFKNVKHVLEVGPGSETPIMAKTIPFLRALKSHVDSFIYTAVDATREYAEQASKLVNHHLEGIQTQALEIDFLTSNAFQDIKKDNHPDDKKLMICFGQPIFANNTDSDIKKLLKNIAQFLHEGDYILFGVDTNYDEALLEGAYDTKLGGERLLNAMYYLKCTLQLNDFNPEAFDYVCKWNNNEKKVELSLKAITKQAIKIGDQEIIISEGQEFNLMNSRKLPINMIKGFLEKVDIVIKNEIPSIESNDNTFSMIIAQKKANI